MMSSFFRYALAATLLFGGCSSPADGPKPAPDGGEDAAIGLDMESSDVGPEPDGHDGLAPVDMSVPFDFGFDAQPFDFVLEGLQEATVIWEGTERDGEFFLFNNGQLGTLSFEADGRHYTYRLQGEFHFSGNVLLGLTERSCSESGVACDEEIPAELLDNMVYDAIGRYDGEQIVFAPLTVRANALELAPDFDFSPPLDPRMTPNDGFKPAQVPDARGNWVGQLTFIPSGQALSSSEVCNIVIDQIGADYVLESMECGETTYTLDANPGPDSTSLEVDTADWLVSFDFVDGSTRYTIAGFVDTGTWAGVVVEADRYDQLGSPLNADVGDVDGLFYFSDVP